MKAKNLHKERAIELRKQGLSYSEILKQVPVSVNSLSLWLRSVPLSDQQTKRLARLNLIGQKEAAKAKHVQRLNKTILLQNEVNIELPSLLTDPFFCAGLALYWAEGNKIKPWHVSVMTGFSNSDPKAILFMRKWFVKFFDCSDDQFTYTLHIHKTADIELAKEKWAEILNIPADTFRVTIKQHDGVGRHKNENYKGLIQLRLLKSVWFTRRIEMWTNGMADQLHDSVPFYYAVGPFPKTSLTAS